MLISHVAIRFLGVITSLLAIRYFLPVDFGYSKAAISIMGFFEIICELGFGQAYTKIQAEADQKDAAFTVFVWIKTVLTIVASISVIFITIYFINLGVISKDPRQLTILGIVFFQYFFSSFGEIYERSFRAKMLISNRELPLLFSSFLGFILSLITILVFQNYLLFIGINIITHFLKLVIYIYYGRIFKLVKLDKPLFKRFFSLNLIFLVPVAISILNANLGSLIFLSFFTEEALGIYAVILTIFAIIKELQKSFQLLLIPNLTDLFSRQKYDEIKSSIHLFEKYMLTLNGLIIMGGIIFAEFIITTFLGQIYYEQGLFLYYGFLFSLLSIPLLGSFSSLLVVIEKFKVYMLMNIIGFVISLLTWIFLIPHVGIIGIDLGAWLFIIPQTIILRIYFSKVFPIRPYGKKEYGHFGILVISVAACFYVDTFHLSFIFSGLWLIIIAGSYVGLLFLLKIFGKKDIRYVLDLINAKKMFSYIKSESFSKNANESNENSDP